MALLDNLVACWPLFEGSGAAAADPYGGHTATLTNMEAGDWTTSPWSGAVELDGVNEWLSVADAADLQITGALSLAIWLNYSALAGDDGGLISKSKVGGKWFSANANKVYELGILNDVCYLQVSSGAAAGLAFANCAALEDGDWHQIVGTWRGDAGANAINLYFDGSPVDSRNGVIAAIQTSNDLLAIGGYDVTYPFAGKIALPAIWSRELSASEVSVLHGNPGLLVSASRVFRQPFNRPFQKIV